MAAVIQPLLLTSLTLGLVAGAAAAGDPPGAAVVTLPTTSLNLELGDVDGDGLPDLVGAATGQLFVHLGDGVGGFGAALTQPAAVGAGQRVRLADCDGDGRDDAVLLGAGGAGVSVRLASGAGGFGPALDVPGSAGALALDVGDLDADGRADIVSITGGAALVRLHRSLGAVGFAPAVSVPTTGLVSQLKLGDGNGDGRADLVLVQGGCGPQGCRPVVMRFAQVGGGFGPDLPVAATTPVGQASLHVQDMDGDGLADVLTREELAWRLRRSDGAGQFAPPRYVAGPEYALDERLFTDENRDGLVDVLMRTSSGVQPTWVLFTQTVGQHGFEASSPTSAFTGQQLLAADVDRDGAADRVLAWRAFGPFKPSQALALLGDGRGGLREAWAGDGVYDPRVADFDLDGYPDVVVAGEVRLARGRSGGRLGTLEPLGLAPAGWLRAVDLDADGLLDLLTSSRPGSSLLAAPLRANLASAPAVFVADPAPLTLSADEQQLALEAGDLDGDGDVDVARVSFDGLLASHVLRSVRNDGGGALSDAFATQASFDASVRTLRLGDLDLDGDLDALIATGTIGALSTALNLGDGQFDPPFAAVPAGGVGTLWDAALGDTDGDGLLDLHVGGVALSGGVVGLARFAGQGDGTFGAGQVSADPGSSTFLGSGLTCADVDADGDLDLVSEGEGLLFWLGDGAGGFTAQAVMRGPGEPNPGFRGTLGDVDRDGVLDIVHCGSLGLVVRGEGPWTRLGQSLAGGAGFSRLSGAGPLTAGSNVEWLVEHAAPGAPGKLVVGLSSLSAPFQGGSLVPFPDVLLPLVSDAAGEALVTVDWPAGAPGGAQLFAQAWFVQGQPAATTAVLATVP